VSRDRRTWSFEALTNASASKDRFQEPSRQPLVPPAGGHLHLGQYPPCNPGATGSIKARRRGSMRTRFLPILVICVSSQTLWGPAEAAPRKAEPSLRRAARPADGWRGIHWETSLAAAKARAERTGKPLFLLHLFGRLDEEFC
jgi:hypothetical protein